MLPFVSGKYLSYFHTVIDVVIRMDFLTSVINHHEHEYTRVQGVHPVDQVLAIR